METSISTAKEVDHTHKLKDVIHQSNALQEGEGLSLELTVKY